MERKTIIISTLFSIITAVVTTLAVCAFFFYDKPAQTNELRKPVAESEATPPKKAELSPMPPPENVNESDVEALTIETVYKDFYAEGSKCRQTYNEYFKNTDGVGSSSSPCSVKLTFNRDGSADKTIEVRRYDTKAKGWQTVEKTVWKSKIAGEDFKGLAKLIVNNQAFKDWSDSIMINVSNCKISVKHTGGTKSPMSNVGPTATAYLPMVEAFKALDAKTDWKSE